jgi:hypothetical protein
VILVAVVARRTEGLGQRNQWNEEDGEGALDAHHLLDVGATASRAGHRKAPDPARAPTHAE